MKCVCFFVFVVWIILDFCSNFINIEAFCNLVLYWVMEKSVFMVAHDMAWSNDLC